MALDYYLKASDLGSLEASAFLSTVYLEGNSVQKDSQKGFAFIERIALSNAHENQVFQEKICEACSLLGLEYLSGNHVKRDKNKANFFLKKASLLGDKSAANWLE